MPDSILYNELIERHIGYKVVAIKNSRTFEPATSAALQRITYKIERETRQEPREHGAFALFDTQENAREFAKGLSHRTAILLVEYEPSDEEELWKKLPPVWVGGRHGHLESQGTTQRPLRSCPKGTVLAKSVYPLEVIEYVE